MTPRWTAIAWTLQAASLAALVIGAGVLGAMSAAASLDAYGSIQLVEGYWLGPLPWAPG